jgi:hypothetical protein
VLVRGTVERSRRNPGASAPHGVLLRADALDWNFCSGDAVMKYATGFAVLVAAQVFGQLVLFDVVWSALGTHVWFAAVTWFAWTAVQVLGAALLAFCACRWTVRDVRRARPRARMEIKRAPAGARTAFAA